MATAPVVPAPASAPASSVPSWARKVMSAFPLYEWPAAEAPGPGPGPGPDAGLQQPVLYVAPGHPAAPPSRRAAVGRTWASADPRCLRWQVMFLLSNVPFTSTALDPLDAWGPADEFTPSLVPGTLPFVQLPPRARQPRAVPASQAAGLVSSTELPDWLTGVVEAEQKKEQTPGKDARLEAEAKVWMSLLETKLMAGVLLQRHDVLLLEWQAERAKDSSAPLLEGYARSHLRGNYLSSELRRIHALSPSAHGAWGSETFGLSPASERGAVGVMRVVAAAKTFLSHVSVGVDGAEVPTSGPGAASNAKAEHAAHVDPVAVYEAASVALDAFVSRIEAEASTGSGPEIPMLRTDGASSPAQRALVALAFALLHTLLSLPYDERPKSRPADGDDRESLRNTTLGRWRRTVLDCAPLAAWVRSVYTTVILPQGK